MENTMTQTLTKMIVGTLISLCTVAVADECSELINNISDPAVKQWVDLYGGPTKVGDSNNCNSCGTNEICCEFTYNRNGTSQTVSKCIPENSSTFDNAVLINETTCEQLSANLSAYTITTPSGGNNCPEKCPNGSICCTILNNSIEETDGHLGHGCYTTRCVPTNQTALESELNTLYKDMESGVVNQQSGGHCPE